MGQMCCGPQLNEQEKADIIRDRVLGQELRRDQLEEERKVKLLLLGAGESGKSTLFKQMKINYKEPYTKAELLESRNVIWRNIVENFKDLLDYTNQQARNLGTLEPVKEKFLHDYEPEIALDPEIGREIKQLWNSKGVQETWAERSKFQLLDALEYYCNDIDRIASPTYEPEVLDFLHARIRSTGMREQTFRINKVDFVILDVGGQRSERRKWIQCFDNVTAILFVAAVNEFDQVLYEDSKTNRLIEALNLFKRTLNFKVFRETPIILFLNKVDLFEKKMQELKERQVDLDQYFPELKLGKNYDSEEAEKVILENIRSKFEKLSKPGRVYTHFVTATDTDNVKLIFNSTVEIVLARTLNQHFYSG